MNGNKVLEVLNLSLNFHSKCLFHNLSFSLEKGEKAIITGKSGSGKTSLLKCLMGFSLPDRGTITIKGNVLSEYSIWKTRRNIGFVPQEPELGDTTVLDFLKRPFSFKANKSLQWDDSLLDELLFTFHLDRDNLHKNSKLLSGGEKQRIALLSSLLLKREIYFLDEVTAALDDETRRSVIEYLRDQDNVTFLFVSHDKEIKALSHKTITLKKEQRTHPAS
ncbi:ATP-binding cassette domain-containing protein [Acidobacteriota bacterium]